MENLNIAEILKDCPKGMELDCIICNDTVKLEGVSGNDSSYPIRFVCKDGYHHSLTAFGYVYDHENAKCVIFPKGKTTWEGFQRPFKDGDVLVSSGGHIVLLSHIDDKQIIYYHCILEPFGSFRINETPDCGVGKVCDCTLATDEQRDRLFDRLKNSRYKWNPQTNRLEKLIVPRFKVGDKIRHKTHRHNPFFITEITESSYKGGTQYEILIEQQDNFELVPNKFDITTLKPFDMVLVRLNKDNQWGASFFSHVDEYIHSHCYKFVTTSGKSYPYCIPYEENKHLLGTADDCNEYYKTWE